MSTEVAQVPSVSPKLAKAKKATKKAVPRMEAKVKKMEAVAPSHPPFATMIRKAISALKEKGGSSQMAILKYIMSNYQVGSDPRKTNTRIRLALRRGVNTGELVQPKGPSGRVKLSDKVKATVVHKKPVVKKVAKKAPSAAKPAAKTVKKSPAKAKKPSVKKPISKVTTPKKAKKPVAAKPKVKKSPKKAAPAKKTAAKK